MPPNVNPKLKSVSFSAAKLIFLILKETGKITVDAFLHNSHASRFGYGHGPKYHRGAYHRTASRLRQQGFLSKQKEIYKLTFKGEKEAFFTLLDFYKATGIIKQSKNKQKWDGKWRMILFDIPEEKRRYRDELRGMIKLIGFKEFQKSIWVYPYPVPNFLKEILFEEGIKHYTRLITTSSIEYDLDLRKKFKL